MLTQKVADAGEQQRDRSRVEHVLGLFAEIHPGEGVLLLLLLLNVFLILVGYYILKPVREELLQSGFIGFSPNNSKVVLTGISALVLLFLVPVYSHLVDRYSRLSLLNVSMGFVIVSLTGFYALAQARISIGPLYFVWLSMVSLFLVAQFWSYANDLHTEEAGKRLFAIIAVGMASGAIVGSYAARSYRGDKLPLLLLAAAILAVATLLYNIIERHSNQRSKRPDLPSTTEQRARAEEQVQSTLEPSHERNGPFALVFHSRYLRLIAMLMVLANVVNTTGEFILYGAANEAAEIEHPSSEFAPIADETARNQAQVEARGKAIRAFYANFYFWVNLLGLFLQVFVVSRVFKYLGVRTAFLILPVIAFGGYALIASLGWIAVVWLAKTAENATDYSLQNTVKQVFYLPTTRDEKYKAKTAIDTFFVRSGDLLAVLVTMTLGIGLGLHRQGFALVNLGFVAMWLLVAHSLAKEHKKIATT